MTALPAGGDGSAIVARMKAVLADYATTGIPLELVDAAKRGEIASAEFQRNSIPDLASAWSEALAANGRKSPDGEVAAIRAVRTVDVDRVAKEFLMEPNSVTGILRPVPAGGPVSSKGFGGDEKLTSAPTRPVVLPAWAEGEFASLGVPKAELKVVDTKLANGLRLIVKTDKTSPTVTVLGNVRHEANLETPPGKEGIESVLEELFSYGAKTLDRFAFQKALDDIAANESAGFNSSVRVLKHDFSRGVELLADNELNPALPAEAFTIVKQQTAEFVKGISRVPATGPDGRSPKDCCRKAMLA